MRKRTTSLVALVTPLVMAGVSYAAPPQTAADTGAERVALVTGRNLAAKARQILVGGGIDLGEGVISAPFTDPRGNEWSWEVYQDADAGPMHHTKYRQLVRDRSGQRAVALGAYLLTHFSQGHLTSVHGTQFRGGIIVNKPHLGKEEAVVRARADLARYSGIRPEPVTGLTPPVIADRARHTALVLLSSGDGEHFRYAYITQARDQAGESIDVTLDAETGAITDVEYPRASGCAHPQTGDVMVYGTPQASATAVLLHANTPGQQPSFPYDAVAGNLPGKPGWNAGVMQQTTDSTYRCTADLESYSVFPVGATYNSAPAPWRGDIATDAMRFNVATWQALVTINPYYPNNAAYWALSDRWAVIQADVGGGVDDSWWFRDASALHPADSINFLPVQTHRYSFAAALDMVAHEWGHSIIYHFAGWSNVGTQGEMNEGYADIVGQAIEKTVQPGGSGRERSDDWDVGEDINDNGTYLRSGQRYDGDGGHWAGNNGAYFFNNRFHQQDTIGYYDIHEVGNALNVAFVLLSQGGQNPVCTDHGGYLGCITPAVVGIGLDRARRILMDNLMWYSYPSEGWSDIGQYAAVAGRDDFWGTADCALIQNSIVQSFTKVGYPPRIDSSGGPPYPCN